MGVSRITCMMIATNEVEIVDTPERSECWIKKEGRLHALMLSCPTNKKSEMEAFVARVKETDVGSF